jgi:hypothetical protein
MNCCKKLIQYNPNLEKWNKADFFCFFIVIPAILLLIFLLPQPVKDAFFILNSASFSYSSLLLANYTHTVFLGHLFPNLMVYLCALIVIFNLEVEKKRFYIISLLLFLPISIIISVVSISLPVRLPPILGFSAIVAGFIGYTIYVTFDYLKKKERIELDNFYLFIIFFVNAIIVVWQSPTLNNSDDSKMIILGLALLCLIGAIYQNFNGIVKILKTLADRFSIIPTRGIGYFTYWYIIFGLICLIYVMLPFMIPSEIRVNGSIINTLSHFLGYVFGLFFPMAIDHFLPSAFAAPPPFPQILPTKFIKFPTFSLKIRAAS